MSNRVTKKQVQYRLDTINGYFQDAGKNCQWEMSGRYGYFAIDSGPADGYTGGHTVITGCTKKEIYYQLGVAAEALAILTHDPLPNKKERDQHAAQYEIDRLAFLARMEKLSNMPGIEGFI